MHNPSRAAAREGADDGARGCRRRRAATEDSTSGRGQRQLDGNRSRAARHADRALQRLLASSTLREGSCALATGAQRGLEQLEDNPSRAAALSKGQRSKGKRQLHLHEHEQSRQGAARSAARAGARRRRRRYPKWFVEMPISHSGQLPRTCCAAAAADVDCVRTRQMGSRDGKKQAHARWRARAGCGALTLVRLLGRRLRHSASSRRTRKDPFALCT